MTELNAQTIGPYRSGEIPPPIVVSFTDYSGNPLNLSGYTVRWVYRQHTSAGWPDFASSDPAPVTRNGTLANGPLGQAQYSWQLIDFGSVGYFEGEMWVGNGSNRYSSVRYLWQVLDAISVPSI